MTTFKTIPFGDIVLDETCDFEYISIVAKIDGIEQTLSLSFSDCNLYGDRLKTCIDIIDQYHKIDRIAKNAIKSSFPENETVRYYFQCHLDTGIEILFDILGCDTLENLNIDNVVGSLPAPSLLFALDDGEITVSVDYMLAKDYSDEILCVRMDRNSRVTGFSHES